MIRYKRIQNALDSLLNSTDLTVELKNEKATFGGLNSPSISHQTCQMGLGHQVRHLVVFRNRHHILAVTSEPSLSLTFKGDCKQAAVPAYHFFPLFRFPISRPDWFTGLVQVSYLDGFLHFDEDGTPVFRPYELCYWFVEVEEGPETWKLDIVTPVQPIDEAKIGCKEIHLLPGKKVAVGDRVFAPGVPFRWYPIREIKQYLADIQGVLSPWGLIIDEHCPQEKGQCPYPDSDDCGDCEHNGYWMLFEKKKFYHEKED